MALLWGDRRTSANSYVRMGVNSPPSHMVQWLLMPYLRTPVFRLCRAQEHFFRRCCFAVVPCHPSLPLHYGLGHRTPCPAPEPLRPFHLVR